MRLSNDRHAVKLIVFSSGQPNGVLVTLHDRLNSLEEWMLPQ